MAAVAASDATLATYDSRLKLQQTMILQATASVTAAEADATRAQLDFKRYSALSTSDYASRQRYETADADARKSEAALAKARAELAASQDQLGVLGSQKKEEEARLLQALRPMPGERALAIAAPYAAAVLERLGLSVAQFDGPDLQTLPSDQSYDVIVCEGAVGRTPASWLAALAPNGRLGVVERDGAVGKACVYIAAEDGVGRREVFDSFAPVLSGLELQHGFAF